MEDLSFSSWAEKEIELACKSELDASENKEDAEYGIMCYKSALKAFKSLMEDGHSGYSIEITKSILNRLIDGKCLTAITDTPDIWEEINDNKYQCVRLFSLFKEIDDEGKIKYKDIARMETVDVDNPEKKHYDPFAEKMINFLFPVTMPYLPFNKKIKVFSKKFIVENDHKYSINEPDTVAYLYMELPSGKRIELNKYLKMSDDGHMTEITKEEFEMRREKYEKSSNS